MALRLRSAIDFGLPLGQRDTATSIDLKRALDALAVVGGEAIGGGGINRHQPCVHGWPTLAFGHFGECIAHRSICSGHVV